jgi:hypothetical protein
MHARCVSVRVRLQVFDNAIKVILKNGQMLTFRSILKRDKVLEGLKAMQAWNIELEHGCARRHLYRCVLT